MTPEQERLVEENAEYARRLAHARFPSFIANRHLFDEILSDAYLGLCRAALRYDPARGRFSSFSFTYIVGAMVDGVRSRQVGSRSQIKSGTQPEVGSLNVFLGEDDGDEWISCLVSRDNVEQVVLDREHVRMASRLLYSMSERDRVILWMIFDEVEHAEIAELFGISAARVSQIYNDASRVVTRMLAA